MVSKLLRNPIKKYFPTENHYNAYVKAYEDYQSNNIFYYDFEVYTKEYLRQRSLYRKLESKELNNFKFYTKKFDFLLDKLKKLEKTYKKSYNTLHPENQFSQSMDYVQNDFYSKGVSCSSDYNSYKNMSKEFDTLKLYDKKLSLFYDLGDFKTYLEIINKFIEVEVKNNKDFNLTAEDLLNEKNKLNYKNNCELYEAQKLELVNKKKTGFDFLKDPSFTSEERSERIEGIEEEYVRSINELKEMFIMKGLSFDERDNIIPINLVRKTKPEIKPENSDEVDVELKNDVEAKIVEVPKVENEVKYVEEIIPENVEVPIVETEIKVDIVEEPTLKKTEIINFNFNDKKDFNGNPTLFSHIESGLTQELLNKFQYKFQDKFRGNQRGA